MTKAWKYCWCCKCWATLLHKDERERWLKLAETKRKSLSPMVKAHVDGEPYCEKCFESLRPTWVKSTGGGGSRAGNSTPRVDSESPWGANATRQLEDAPKDME